MKRRIEAWKEEAVGHHQYDDRGGERHTPLPWSLLKIAEDRAGGEERDGAGSERKETDEGDTNRDALKVTTEGDSVRKHSPKKSRKEADATSSAEKTPRLTPATRAKGGQQIRGADADRSGEDEADSRADWSNVSERRDELEATDEEVAAKAKYEKDFAIHKRNNPEPRTGDSGK